MLWYSIGSLGAIIIVLGFLLSHETSEHKKCQTNLQAQMEKFNTCQAQLDAILREQEKQKQEYEARLKKYQSELARIRYTPPPQIIVPQEGSECDKIKDMIRQMGEKEWERLR